MYIYMYIYICRAVVLKAGRHLYTGTLKFQKNRACCLKCHNPFLWLGVSGDRCQAVSLDPNKFRD